MFLDGGDQVGLHLLGVAGDAKRAVGLVAPGATGDLADLLGMQAPVAPAVELAEPGERHMVDIHIEAHANGVGGHQEVHLAGLV